jgi:hypothetical protein
MRVYFTADRLEGISSQRSQMDLGSEITKEGTELTRQFLEESKQLAVGRDLRINSKEVFIVHGHDTGAQNELQE